MRTTQWRGLLTVAATMAATLTTAAGVAAQADAPEPEKQGGKVGCFRGKPLPECRSFWIFEIQGSSPLAQTARTVTYSDPDYPATPQRIDAYQTQLEWNLGHMLNVNDDWALGGVLTVGTGGRDALRGVKARARRWLTPDISLEVEAGAMATTAQSFRYRGVFGATVDARLNIRDQGSFFLGWNGLPLSAETYPYGLSDPGGFQQALLIGVSAGSVPALVATGACGVGVLVLVALFSRWDD